MISYNPYLSGVHEDPYPTYQALRAAEPVHFNPFAGCWFLTRHADCAATLRDPRFSIRLSQQNRAGLTDAARSMLTSDDAEHTRLRSPLMGAFSAHRIKRLRPQVTALTESLLAARPTAERLDVIADLSRPLAIGLLAELFAVPVAARQEFHALARAASAVLDPLAAAEAQSAAERAAEELENFLAVLVAGRRGEPRDDLISVLLPSLERTQGITLAELLMACGLVVLGGYEATVHLIGNGMLALLRSPGELGRLRRDSTLIESAIEEALRYDSPIQFVARAATEDVELEGQMIKQGQTVVCLLGAANRDPAVRPDPDRFRLGRRQGSHLAFGGGAHFCLGAALARLVAQVAIGTMITRYPGLRLESVTPPREPSSIPRGLSSLAVLL